MKKTEVIQPIAIKSPICFNGDRSVLPNTSTDKASIDLGFPYKTQLPLNQGGVAPERTDFNSLFHLSTDQRFNLQNGCVITFSQEVSDAIGGYPKDAILSFIDNQGTYKIIQSLIDDNTYNFVSNPNYIDDIHWREIKMGDTSNKLFDWKLSDKYLWQENPKWLPYNIYTSKQVNGAVKIDIAPRTLLDLYNNGTDFSETIGTVTIAGKRAQNGMKIVKLVNSPYYYYFTFTGSHQYIYVADNNSYSIRNTFNSSNFVKINKGININNTFNYIAYKNFVFTSASDINTPQTIIGRDIIETNIGGGFWLYIENGSIKLQLFQGENANANVNPTLSVTLFSIEPNTTYSISFSYDVRGSYAGNGTIKASLTKTIDQTTTTMEQSFSSYGSIKVNSLLFIGADQKLTADGTVSDYAKWTDFTMLSFLIEYQVNNTLTTYKDFYIPYWTTEIEQVFYNTDCAWYWGVCQDINNPNYITLVPPRNNGVFYGTTNTTTENGDFVPESLPNHRHSAQVYITYDNIEIQKDFGGRNAAGAKTAYTNGVDTTQTPVYKDGAKVKANGVKFTLYYYLY